MMNSAPTPTQSLMARKPMAPPDPKTGVTPDLLTLLSKMAVDKAAEHWQQQQALAQGQTPPTVAQTAGQKAEQVMQQQLCSSSPRTTLPKASNSKRRHRAGCRLPRKSKAPPKAG